MTRERFHELFRGFQYDPDLFADMTIYEKVKDKPYDEWETDAHFIRRTGDPSRLTLAVMLGDSVIGEVMLKNINKAERSCEMGIHLINDTVKGKGYGTEAERAAIEFAKDELNVTRVFADCILKNKRSMHILEKIGFRFLREENGFRYYVYEV